MPAASPHSGSGYRDRNSTADRALDILALFSDERLVLGGAEVADHFGVARSTGYRYLKGLVGASFLEECTGGFRLGPRVFELARLARRGLGLSEIALPVMEQLAQDSQETVLLTTRSGGAVVCVELAESSHPIRISYERGHVLPINAGASAHVLLAWAPESEISQILAATPLQRFTPRTLVERQDLLDRLAQTRRDGIAVSDGELDADVVGIAAPILSPAGGVRAAISVAALSSRMVGDKIATTTSQVGQAAKRISDRLKQIDH